MTSQAIVYPPGQPWPASTDSLRVLAAPPSKSIAQRAIALASLAPGQSQIINPGDSEDVKACISLCRQLGVIIERQPGDQSGTSQLIIQGGIHKPSEKLNCGESGLLSRIFPFLTASLACPITFVGQGSLSERPMQMVADLLRAAGATGAETNGGILPLRIKGPLKGGRVLADGSQSSQHISGLLMGAPMAMAELELRVNNPCSTPYIDVSLSVMKAFGIEVFRDAYRLFSIMAGQTYKACRYHVEGDWSAAAFLIVAAALGAPLKISGLDQHSYQADRMILNALHLAGIAYLWEAGPAGALLRIRPGHIKAFDFDATHCPDLFPPLAILAASATGLSRIKGWHRLRGKESDRASGLCEMLGLMGISCWSDKDRMMIQGGRLRAARVHSRGDHRMVMAAAAAALKADGPVIIDQAACVSKSWPDFFMQWPARIETKI